MKIAKKITSFILSAVIAAGLLAAPTEAGAAAADSAAGAVTLTSGNLNVRSGRSTSSSTVAKLADGSYITLLSKSGSWWYVEYADGKYGYCHSDYITPIEGSAATVSISYGSLNVRSGAGTGYSKKASLYNGETVIRLSTSGSWSRILYHGTKTGWVSSQYLSTPSAYSTYPAVSLSVPSYKQSDSRWASIKIGSSGKTMSQIGCVTTAIAMLESYRSGNTITPADMVWKLSYTSSGSVYWPSDYTVTTSSTNYLGRIYELLRQGKPVLFGAKNSYGGQHWVVITGYTGGSSLTASGFTINDPGSSTRTNLQQFLAAYPTFYKYFYY